MCLLIEGNRGAAMDAFRSTLHPLASCCPGEISQDGQGSILVFQDIFLQLSEFFNSITVLKGGRLQ
jgi:hypothetical protein